MLLDTDVIVNFLRKKQGYDTLFLHLMQEGVLAMSIITYAELLYGTRRAASRTKENRKLDEFIDDFSISALPLTKESVGIYAKTKYELEKEGNKLDEFDLLIGATAVSHEAHLVTRNIKHFSRFPGLRIYSPAS